MQKTRSEILAELQELDRQVEELQEQRRYKHAELVEAVATENADRAARIAKAREDAKRVRDA